MNNFLNSLNLTPINRTRMDSDDQNYYCELCNQCFDSQTYLAEHKLLHSVNGFNLEFYQCRSCPKKFDKRLEFEKHINSHSGRRRYVCIICNKGFSFKAKWQTHLDSHSDGRIHYCQMCPKQFNSQESLKMHESTHFYIKRKYNTKSLLNSGKYYETFNINYKVKKRGRPRKSDISDRSDRTEKKKIGRPRKYKTKKNTVERPKKYRKRKKSFLLDDMEEYKPKGPRSSGAIAKRNKLEEERLQLESLGFFQEKVKRKIGRPRKTAKMEETLKKMQLLNSLKKENDNGLVVELCRIKIENLDTTHITIYDDDEENDGETQKEITEKKRGRPKKTDKEPPKKKLKPIKEKKPRGRPKTKKPNDSDDQCDNITIIKSEEIEENKCSIEETSTLLQVILNEGDFKIDSNDENEINLSPKRNNITLEDLISTLES